MQETWEVIRSAYHNYFYVSGFGVLLFASLLFLLLWEKNRETRQALFWPVLLMLGVVFCPLTADILMKMMGGYVYWRSFWILPVILLGAYTAVQIVSMAGGRGRKVLMALFCAALIAVNGTFVFSDRYFSDRENNYKLPTEVIWVADAINEHAEENKIKRKWIAAPLVMATYIRVYDASIKQMYGRNMSVQSYQSDLYLELTSNEPNIVRLAKKAKEAKCRYVVLSKTVDDEQLMTKKKFEKIYEDSVYAVYFNASLLKGRKG